MDLLGGQKSNKGRFVERDLSIQELQLLGFATMAKVIRSEKESQARSFTYLYRRLVRQVLGTMTYPSLNPDRNLHLIRFAPFEHRLVGAALDSADALVQDPEQLNIIKHRLDVMASSESDELSIQILPLAVQYESDNIASDIKKLQGKLNFG